MRHNRQRRSRRLLWAALTVVMLAGYGYWALARPLALLQPKESRVQLSMATLPGQLAWPGNQAAVGILGTSILEIHGDQKPVPTASTAKIITALVILDKKPLGANDAGPTITLTADDVARYTSYVRQNGSVLKVQAGEQLNEYQMLQALLLPSANNIADTLAIWAYGSLPNYAAAANGYLKSHGLTETHVGSDASGLTPDTTSTARDLVRLGQLAMQQPVLKQIVGQRTATGFPLVNNITNVNSLLGTAGIIGIKTGTSDQAGGAFIGAAEVTIDGRTEIIVTAVLGAPDRTAALQQSLALVQSAQNNFKPITVVSQDTIVGSYRQPWGGSLDVVAGSDLTTTAWNGSAVTGNGKLQALAPTAKTGQIVGELKVNDTAIPLKLKNAPTEPSAWWRLTHPL